jgi:hypothetical protein
MTMTRTFYIAVGIDESRLDESRVVSTTATSNYYRVFVTPSNDKCPLYAIAAHEIGHVLGREFSLPRSLRDPRLNLSFESNLNPSANLIDSEREAWDLAEMVLRVRDARKHALGTYIEAYDPTTAPTFYPYTK